MMSTRKVLETSAKQFLLALVALIGLYALFQTALEVFHGR
jgi:hypothetical protein